MNKAFVHNFRYEIQNKFEFGKSCFQEYWNDKNPRSERMTK